MKAEDLIRDALQELGRQAAEQPVNPDDMATGIRYANRMFRGVDYLGLGFTVITSASQTVTIPPYSEEWAVFKLATRLAAQYPPTDQVQIIAANEREAWVNLLKQHQELPTTSFPCTLPVGSGNEGCGIYGNRFYPCDDNHILTEDGDHILQESGN